MTTWILDAHNNRARIFQKRSPESKAVLYREIGRPTRVRDLFGRVARELDVTCATADNDQVVIYGEEAELAKLLPLLGTNVRNRLVGAFSRQSSLYAYSV